MPGEEDAYRTVGSKSAHLKISRLARPPSRCVFERLTTLEKSIRAVLNKIPLTSPFALPKLPSKLLLPTADNQIHNCIGNLNQPEPHLTHQEIDLISCELESYFNSSAFSTIGAEPRRLREWIAHTRLKRKLDKAKSSPYLIHRIISSAELWTERNLGKNVDSKINLETQHHYSRGMAMTNGFLQRISTYKGNQELLNLRTTAIANNLGKFLKAPSQTRKAPTQFQLQPKARFATANSAAMSMTPKIDQFLTEVNQIIQQGDSEAKDVRDYSSDRLRQYLPIEPKFAEDYNKIIYEMTTFFPKDQEEKLTKKCESLLTKAVDGTWGSFVNFMVGWFAFIKTVNPSNLLETYNSLDDLVQKANLALAHPSLGILMLPTVIAYAEVLCRLAIGLEQQPELIAHLVQTQNTGEGGGEQITLPERAANTLRSAFSTCLTDKSGVKTPLGTDDEGKPAGKKVGIYKIANICLKILFSCNKARNAEQIFANIHQQSPPLAIYPKAQQVTYLYYLGRFHFSTGHFYRAVLALEHAYGLLPAEPTFAPRQKRLLLIYLISASLICGRFPTAALYARPEAAGLEPAFAGITRAIKTGDVALFRAATSLDAARNPHAPFLLRHRVLLPLRGRADVLVQRALLRAVFVARGSQGDSERRAAPTLELAFFVAAARWLEGRALGVRDGGGVPGVRHTNWSFVERALPKAARYVDPDFEGVEELEVEDDEGYDSTDVGMNVGGDDALGQDDEDGDLLLPDNMDMESVCSSLIDQGFLNGWISRGKSVRVAIKGATQKGNALAVGFPNPWEVIKARMLEEGDDDVPGWKRAVTASAGGFGAPFGPGSVVHLSNARPAGSNPFGG